MSDRISGPLSAVKKVSGTLTPKKRRRASGGEKTGHSVDDNRPTEERLQHDKIERIETTAAGVYARRVIDNLELLRRREVISEAGYHAAVQFRADWETSLGGPSGQRYDGSTPPQQYFSRTIADATVEADRRLNVAKAALDSDSYDALICIAVGGYSVAEIATFFGCDSRKAAGRVEAAFDVLAHHYERTRRGLRAV